MRRSQERKRSSHSCKNETLKSSDITDRCAEWISDRIYGFIAWKKFWNNTKSIGIYIWLLSIGPVGYTEIWTDDTTGWKRGRVVTKSCASLKVSNLVLLVAMRASARAPSLPPPYTHILRSFPLKCVSLMTINEVCIGYRAVQLTPTQHTKPTLFMPSESSGFVIFTCIFRKH